MTEAVSRGMLEVAMARRITAASAMTSLPDWPRAARDWSANRPDADLGLHVTLTVGAPLGPMPGLAPAGEAPDVATLARNALLNRLPLAEIEDEIGRQIDAFCDATGMAPTHVDGHQHVHVLPGIRSALFRALARRGLGEIHLRDSSDAPRRIAARGASAAKALKVNALAIGYRKAARRAGFRLNDGFAGYSSFAPEACGASSFAGYLTAPGSSHLIMCHPGRVDDALRRLDPVTSAREAELAFLISQEFQELLARRGAKLVRLSSDLSRP